jgi:hypothetical protein
MHTCNPSLLSRFPEVLSYLASVSSLLVLTVLGCRWPPPPLRVCHSHHRVVHRSPPCSCLEATAATLPSVVPQPLPCPTSCARSGPVHLSRVIVVCPAPRHCRVPHVVATCLASPCAPPHHVPEVTYILDSLRMTYYYMLFGV